VGMEEAPTLSVKRASGRVRLSSRPSVFRPWKNSFSVAGYRRIVSDGVVGAGDSTPTTHPCRCSYEYCRSLRLSDRPWLWFSNPRRQSQPSLRIFDCASF
jgi:hypothetical protein